MLLYDNFYYPEAFRNWITRKLHLIFQLSIFNLSLLYVAWFFYFRSNSTYYRIKPSFSQVYLLFLLHISDYILLRPIIFLKKKKKASINTRFKIKLLYQIPSYTLSQQICITMPPLLLSCHQQFRYRKWTDGYKYFLQSMSRFRFQDYRFRNRLPLL